MKIVDCIQGSEEWYEARLGFVTASNFHKVLSKKSGRGLYMDKITAERAWGVREVDYSNKNMEHGSETEAEARRWYEMANDCKVEQVGFVMRDEWVGGSPDGLVGEDGIIEIKCPIPSTHVKTIRTGKMDTKYIPQVQGLLWITERKWCEFVSFVPDAISRPMFTVRVEWDQDYFIKLAGEVGVFVNELKAMIDKIDSKF